MADDIKEIGKALAVFGPVTAIITYVVTRLSAKAYCPDHMSNCQKIDAILKTQDSIAADIKGIYKILNGDDGRSGMSQRMARTDEFIDSLRRLLEKGGAVV